MRWSRHGVARARSRVRLRRAGCGSSRERVRVRHRRGRAASDRIGVHRDVRARARRSKLGDSHAGNLAPGRFHAEFSRPPACARGGWIGLTAKHRRADLIRSVIEGVSYSQRDCLDIIEELGVAVRSVRASGGGARSPFWRQRATTSPAPGPTSMPWSRVWSSSCAPTQRTSGARRWVPCLSSSSWASFPVAG